MSVHLYDIICKKNIGERKKIDKEWQVTPSGHAQTKSRQLSQQKTVNDA